LNNQQYHENQGERSKTIVGDLEKIVTHFSNACVDVNYWLLE
jgi:hypothetical protein